MTEEQQALLYLDSIVTDEKGLEALRTLWSVYTKKTDAEMFYAARRLCESIEAENFMLRNKT